MGRFIKNILGIFERLFFFIEKQGVYVINYHGTPKSLEQDFEDHLEYYIGNFYVLNPEEFEQISCFGIYPESPGPFLLLTFDDGMQNNRNALRLLEERKIRAYFFVVPAFIESGDPRQYLAKTIRPGYVNKLETEEEDFMPMDWETLRQAINKGHKVGSHTYSHSLLKEDGLEKSVFEIERSKEFIEEKLAASVPYFCSINNTDISIGPVQESLVRKNYQYHFTTYYGDNLPALNPQRIERINVEAYWSMNEVRFALGNLRKMLRKK